MCILVMHRYFSDVIALHSLLPKYKSTQSLLFLFIHRHFLDHYHHLRESIQRNEKEE